MTQTDQRLPAWLRSLGPWVIVFGLVWGVSSAFEDSSAAITMVGESAPELTVSLQGGGEFNLQRAQGVTVVNFWASWCRPCRAEAPVLARAHSSLRGQGRVLGLTVHAPSIPVAGRLGMNYPQALISYETMEDFGVQMLPSTFVISGGYIHRAFVGDVTSAQLSEAIAEAAAGGEGVGRR